MWNGSCSSCKRSSESSTDVQTMIGQSSIPLRVTGRSLVAWQNIACLFEQGHLLYARSACETTSTHTHTHLCGHMSKPSKRKDKDVVAWLKRETDRCLSVSAGFCGSTGDQGLNVQLKRTEQKAFRFRDWTERKSDWFKSERTVRPDINCLYPSLRCVFSGCPWPSVCMAV